VATQRLIRFAPVLGMSDERYAKMMTLNLRLMKNLGRA
jgi:succinate-semialdehyde dehydrogenase / glutarate-semialdehyde dehydrogenase